MRLGAHMSIAGGLAQALRRGAKIGCETIQMFTMNNTRWQGRPLPDEIRTEFALLRQQLGIQSVFAHSPYLINLASPDPTIWERSAAALAAELERCEALALSFLVIHPGSHRGAGEAAGVDNIARGLRRLLAPSPRRGVRVLLETTAGQGNDIGHRFEHLRDILDAVNFPSRIGVCLDTCHIFAAGYDIRRRKMYDQTIAQFDATIGLARLFALHLNDSKKALGSHVDRHEHIGQGYLGLEPFRFILNDPRLTHLPAVLETPKDDTGDLDRRNLDVLRALIKKSTSPPV